MRPLFRLIVALGAAGLIACASPADTGGGPGTTLADSATQGDAAPGDTAAGDAALTDATPADAAASDASIADAATADATQADAAQADGAGAGKDCAQVSTTGVPPDSPVAAPTFAAVLDHDGKSVDPAALKGKWTVMWFYPAASTAG